MYRKSGGVGSQSGWTDLFRKGLFGRIRIAAEAHRPSRKRRA